MTDKPTTDIVETLPAEMVHVPKLSEDLVVLARDPMEMERAQHGLITWFEGKLAAEKAQLADCEENLATAKQMKVRTQGWKRQVNIAKHRVVYYEKGLEALREGYCIVPEFPVQLIAVRTTKKRPKRGWKRGRGWNIQDTEATPHLAKGEGEYIAPDPTIEEEHVVANDDSSKSYWRSRAVDFRAVDFPFKKVKPQILKDLNQAMRRKLFDEIGILPGSRRASDPVLVGRIKRKLPGGYGEAVLSFLITWWIDTRDL